MDTPSTVSTKAHYDLLIEEGNDPVLDPPELAAYMDGWDGPEFLRLLGLTGREHVLEIGVGTGRLALRTAPRCLQFTGVDLSPKTLARAAEHLHPYPNVSLLCGDFLTMDLSGPYDVIYAALTMFHIASKAEAARRLAALLTPGGRVVLSLDKAQDICLDYGTRQVRLYPDDPKTMTLHLQAAGLTITETIQTEFAWLIKAIK